MKLQVSQLINHQVGHLIKGSLDQEIFYISNDTRKIKAGDVYLALRGENFDGHDFIIEAVDKKVSGLIIETDYLDRVKDLKGDFFVIEVQDSLKALGDIAHIWRNHFSIPIIGITGSSGKTSTKEMLSLCLKSKSVCSTKGNFNNLVGLPLSLLNLDAKHEVGIFELGMNAFGEILRLTQILKPTIGMITNIGRAHLEGVGSIEGVAQAKSEMFSTLQENDIALVNVDDYFISSFDTKAKKVMFGFSDDADIKLKDIEKNKDESKVTIINPEEEIEFHLPFSADYMIKNFLAVYSICYLLEISPMEIQKRISEFEFFDMRGNIVKLKSGLTIINDAYNANPDSMNEALTSLMDSKYKGRKIAFLGEMLELGSQSEDLHEELGELVGQLKVEALFIVGSKTKFVENGFRKYSQAPFFSGEKVDDLKDEFIKYTKTNDTILIKGSRKNKLERILDWLE